MGDTAPITLGSVAGTAPFLSTDTTTATTATTTDSSDGSDDGSGFDWNNLVTSAGSLLTGGADVIAALNGNAIAGTAAQTATKGGVINNGPSISASSNTTWVVIGVVMFLIVVLYLIFGKKK